MNPLLLIITLALTGLQLGLSRKWAFLPLLIAACHTPYTPFLGGFTAARVIILVGLLRAASKGWLKWNRDNPLDVLIIVFAAIALISTVGHAWHPYNPLIARLRLVMDVLGTYLYMRSYLADHESMERFAAGLAIILMPFAFFLLAEKHSGLNAYAAVGAGSFHSLVREGEFRAQGPFGTPILAGTVGGGAVPLLLLLLKKRRRLAIAGLIAAAVVVYASASSGPISTAVLGLAMMAFWRWRENLRPTFIWLCVLLLVLQLIKERPIWYLMALMDLVGGSTGWHRAYLIDMAIQHLNEWWLLGSDYTRHWMPYGLESVPEHCDLTNYYIHLGVTAGLGLVICLLAIQWKSFRMLLDRIHELRGRDTSGEFALWCVFSTLFAHAVTFLSISYFDQIYVFFWGLLGGLTGFLAPSSAEESGEVVEASAEVPADQLVWGKGQARMRAEARGPDPG